MNPPQSTMQASGQAVFRIAGQDGRPTVICLHSSASSSRQWRSFRDRAAGYNVITPDLVGYGTGEWRKERTHSMLREVRMIERLVDRFREPVHLVGHSFGGAVALLTALERPEKFISLAVYEPVLFPLLFASGKPSGREIWVLQSDIRRMVRQGRLQQAAETFVDYWNAPGAFASLNAGARERVIGAIPKVASEFGALVSTPITGTDIRPLSIPTLLLSGDRSPDATRDIVGLLAEMLPRRTTIQLEGMGHMGPVTHSDRVDGIIRGYIEQRDREDRPT